MINLICPSRYLITRKKIKEAVKQMLFTKGLSSSSFDLNLIFVGRKKMKELAKNYKGEDEALPVLSFPYHEKQEEKIFLGEIFICYPQAVLLAAQRSKKVDEILLFLIKHAVDNLIG